ncbi:putative protein phosphatase 2C 33 [Raphanus sativus]|nr:putative protein phosphatase 2C 33 [Raphanus sativus]KAJ4892744.1 putative protein phosphatase 2C 33 [Raphanus sativus]
MSLGPGSPCSPGFGVKKRKNSKKRSVASSSRQEKGLKDFGLISVPDVSFRRLTEKDEFIVLASDGIWDVLSNEEVVAIVASAPSRSSAARALVESAVRAWRYKYPTSKVDDCAAVCLYLDSNNNTNVLSTASSISKLEDEDVEELKIENDDASGRSSTDRTGKEIALDESEVEKLIKEEIRTWNRVFCTRRCCKS